MEKPRSFAPMVVAVLLFMLVLYIGSYFALVVPNPGSATVRDHMDWKKSPYRFGGEFSRRIYWPLEQIDRLVRPDAWELPFVT